MKSALSGFADHPQDQTEVSIIYGDPEGNEVEMPEDHMAAGGRVIHETVMAFHGRHPDPRQAFENFGQMFGHHELPVFLHEMMSPQTEGLVPGDDPGMDDTVHAKGPGRDIALSAKEYVIPADIVAALGDGNSDAGAKWLDSFVSIIRGYKYGRDEQPPQMSGQLEKILKLLK